MAKGSSSRSVSPAGRARDPTPSRSDSASVAAAIVTPDDTLRVQFEDVDDQGHMSEDGGDEKEGKSDEEEEFLSEMNEEEDAEEMSLQVTKMGTPRPVGRSLVVEFGEDADDDEQDVVPSQRPPRVPRATRNADTPSANKVLANLGEDMRSTGGWLSKFEPKPMAQAKWPVLGPELAHPVSSADLPGLVYETSTLLRAMGFHCMGRPSRLEQKKWTLKAAGNEVMQWKMKLRTAFGLERIPDVPGPRAPRLAESMNSAGATAELPVPVAESAAMAVDPSRIPLPKTPDVKRSREASRATGGTPYFGIPTCTRHLGGQPNSTSPATRLMQPSPTTNMTPGRPKLIRTSPPPRHYIQQLSLEDSDRSRSNVLEV
ncbi:hypothetical protein PF010_g18276 [Phytophthora fragariae]|uniref:Uncharacterized protein n=1 Tax=Phytophthora fragariae TaxID=53985 RepID=A0A6A3RCJ7_9STRA|nr:hypothetical protein PF003_g31602 [Phytophthora fragariae]KAE8931999.1 hypothetical protein PF009_g17956 [Phytophthora fragariae]KAE9091207.1 hypothetical protein PF010_g18276 [Phytophthora fragariae]KAE9094653.1 hypothetical protein PF007_g17687 [Phytophthora fragariae]KAE9118886.1 hypothetical protein PF006_g18480 [Phytophthora fragariae]